jgi:dihydropteroate synthase
VDEDDELRRVIPALRAVREALPAMPLTIDTTKPAVAEAALDAGADAINDVWGVSEDGTRARIAADRKVPYILMHNRAEPVYRDLLREVMDDLRHAIDRAVAVGVAEADIVIDPGFGFGKTAEHNLQLLRRLGELAELGVPLAAGLSRKATIGQLTGRPVHERLAGSLAMALLALQGGARILRVHDVRETRDVISVWQAYGNELQT